MSEDKRNFIERAISLSQTMNGTTPTPEELGTEFAKFGARARTERLEAIRADLKDAQHTPRQAADHLRYERVLRNVHEKLRAIGR